MSELDHTDLTAARSALLFTLRVLTARREPVAAFDHALTAVEAAMTPTTSANGSHPETPCHHEYVDTATAAKMLGTSERWARDLAPRIGGIKQAGRWLIPKQSLPEEE